MRNSIIDNLRGLCLLGVIAIHIGSLALVPGEFSLYILLEVLSRYSVPTFFFISGYGLCASDKALIKQDHLDYKNFLSTRFRSAGLPYLSWSFFYIFYFWLVLPAGSVSLNPKQIIFVLFFGLACYHLYFMVILLWFYAFYPLWRKIFCIFMQNRKKTLLWLLLIGQFAFNWWTTHHGLNPSEWQPILKNFFIYRLNYLPLHYLFIFMSGGFVALYWHKFISFLRAHITLITIFYFFSIMLDIGSCYYSASIERYDLMSIANTYHQLSPQGLLYTIASILFFCLVLDWLEKYKVKGNNYAITILNAIKLLSTNSMLIYFVHPLILDQLTNFYQRDGIVMTVKKVCFSYIILVLISLIFSMLLSKFYSHCKILRLLFTGKK